MIASVARALATVRVFVPRVCLRHRWDDVHCEPPACTRCGRRGFPRDPFDVFGAD